MAHTPMTSSPMYWTGSPRRWPPGPGVPPATACSPQSPKPRQHRCFSPVPWRPERADFLCLGALLTPPGGVGDPRVLLQAAVAVSLDGGVVDEHVGGPVVRGDEAVALVGVEPFDGAFSHVLLP